MGWDSPPMNPSEELSSELTGSSNEYVLKIRRKVETFAFLLCLVFTVYTAAMMRGHFSIILVALWGGLTLYFFHFLVLSKSVILRPDGFTLLTSFHLGFYEWTRVQSYTWKDVERCSPERGLWDWILP